jgi:RNA polymerase sigma factor (sigma-70 family)
VIDPSALRIETLLRELAPEVLGAVARRVSDFGAAEDAVQEALTAAATQWPREGVPDEPRAWLVHVARRRLTDQARAEIARRRREELVVSLVPFEDQLALAPDDEAAVPGDDTLLLLFMCCHPALTRASAVALTLRAVGGLTTAEIARAFFVPEATMAQRISRAKEAIGASNVPFERPAPADVDARIASVLHVLYLVFSEGYAASSGDAVHRVDLSREAIRIARMLHAAMPDHAETTGLLALMLLTDARRDARTGESGELIPLDEQDRARWDRDAIAEGIALATRALVSPIGAYAVQAAIAALHDEASSTETTDWAQIVTLYGLLARVDPSPMVALNAAVAIAMVYGPDAGLAKLASIENDPRLREGHRLDAVRGHLHERAGRLDAAIPFYLRAAERTASTPEREYLLMRAARLRDVS